MKIRVAAVPYEIKLQFVAVNDKGTKVYETNDIRLTDYLFFYHKPNKRFFASYDPGSVNRWTIRRAAQSRGERTGYLGRLD